MSKSLWKTGAVIVMAVMAGACGEQKQKAPDPASIPVPVNLADVHKEQAIYHERFPATVVAQNQVDVRSVVEGYVTGIFFKEGGHVSKGEKLYTIDDRKYQASYNQVQANVQVAQSNLDLAQKDAERYIYLNEHDAVAKQTLDRAMTTLQNAKNQLAAARQDLIKTQTDLNFSVIKAPFDGTIGISQVKLGNTVTPGQTVLNTISSDGPVFVDFVVNEKQIPRFVKLQQKKDPTKDSVFTLLMPDNSVYPYPGQISMIDRGVNPQTGSITIRLSFPNRESMLKAGMSCTVLVKNDDSNMQILIPLKAVTEQMGEYSVFVARDSAGGSILKAAQKKIFIGQTIKDKVIVLSGLEEGERIVVDGVQKLHDGMMLAIEKGSQKNSGH